MIPSGRFVAPTFALLLVVAVVVRYMPSYVVVPVDKVDADLVYYNRLPHSPSMSRVPKTGSENLAFIIKHLAARVSFGGSI